MVGVRKNSGFLYLSLPSADWYWPEAGVRIDPFGGSGTTLIAAEKAGRDATRVIAALPVCVTNDRAAALERAAKVFVVYGQLPSYRAMLDKEGAAGPADIAIIGSEAEVAERIASLADIGVTDFAAVEFGATPDEINDTRNAVKSLLK